jgi:hypothetical protein
MAKQKNTNLKLSEIKSAAKKAHQKEVYELENGKTITFYPLFPDLMIDSLLEELQKHMVTLKEKEINLSEKMTLMFINLMIIKHFTHFKSDMPDTVLGDGKNPGLLDWLEHFADTGLMKTIMDEVFMQDQVMKVYDKLTEFLGTTMLLDELGEKTIKHFENLKLKNADLIRDFDNKIVQ